MPIYRNSAWLVGFSAAHCFASPRGLVGAAGTRRWLCVGPMYRIRLSRSSATHPSQNPFRISHNKTSTLVHLGLHLFRPLSTCDAIREQTIQGLRSRVPVALNIAIVVHCDSGGGSPNQQTRSS